MSCLGQQCSKTVLVIQSGRPEQVRIGLAFEESNEKLIFILMEADASMLGIKKKRHNSSLAFYSILHQRCNCFLNANIPSYHKTTSVEVSPNQSKYSKLYEH